MNAVIKNVLVALGVIAAGLLSVACEEKKPYRRRKGKPEPLFNRPKTSKDYDRGHADGRRYEEWLS